METPGPDMRSETGTTHQLSTSEPKHTLIRELEFECRPIDGQYTVNGDIEVEK